MFYVYIYEHYERFAYRYEYVHFTYSYLAMVQGNSILSERLDDDNDDVVHYPLLFEFNILLLLTAAV